MNSLSSYVKCALWQGALLVLLTALLSACSDSDAPKDGDAGPFPDATPVVDARGEDAASKEEDSSFPKDASSEGDASPDGDGDGGCACTTDARASVGSTPLACFCDVPGGCSNYSDAISCNGQLSRYLVLETYTDCDWVNVRLETGFISVWHVYDKTTLALVGARASSDFPSYPCGASTVFTLSAGVDPVAAGCHVAAREKLCADEGGAEPPPDAGPDAAASFDVGDGDGGCACTENDAGTGLQSLPCFCAGIFACSDYDNALHTCVPSPWPGQDGNRIDTYASCNLVVIRSPDSFGIRSFVYDATTHALVGGSRYSDTNEFVCGSGRVFGYQAGTFPPPSCPLTESVPRCLDGGDGGNDAADGSDAADSAADSGDAATDIGETGSPDDALPHPRR